MAAGERGGRAGAVGMRERLARRPGAALGGPGAQADPRAAPAGRPGETGRASLGMSETNLYLIAS